MSKEQWGHGYQQGIKEAEDTINGLLSEKNSDHMELAFFINRIKSQIILTKNYFDNKIFAWERDQQVVMDGLNNALSVIKEWEDKNLPKGDFKK